MLALADVAVVVADARAAAKWWRESLGFETHTVGPPGGHALMVAPPGDRFLLHLCEGFAAAEPGNTGIAFVTDDIDGVVRRMEEAGVRITDPLKRGDWGSGAKFSDPDGNIFWLIGAPTSFILKETRRRAGKDTAPGLVFRGRGRRRLKAARTSRQRKKRPSKNEQSHG